MLCVVREKLVVIDWKTSERIKFSLEQAYDDPVQLAAYVGSLQHSPLFDLEVRGLAPAQPAL